MPNPIAKFFIIAQEEGLRRAFFPAFRRAVRPLVWWQEFILVTRELDGSLPVPPLPPGFTLKPVGEGDIEHIRRDMGDTEERATIYRARLAHFCRGYYVENESGEVIYVDWRAPGPAPWLGAVNEMALGPGEAMFLDGHVRPDFRGKGIHTSVFPLMLNEAFRDGFSRAYVLHLPENTVAIHIHDKKYGMRPIKKFYVFHYLGRARTFERPIQGRRVL